MGFSEITWAGYVWCRGLWRCLWMGRWPSTLPGSGKCRWHIHARAASQAGVDAGATATSLSMRCPSIQRPIGRVLDLQEKDRSAGVRGLYARLPKRTMLWCRFSVVSVSMVSFSSFSFNGFSLICFGFGSSALPAALPARLACLLGVCLLNLFAKTLFFEGGSWLSFGHAAGCGSRTTDVR